MSERSDENLSEKIQFYLDNARIILIKTVGKMTLQPRPIKLLKLGVRIHGSSRAYRRTVTSQGLRLWKL